MIETSWLQAFSAFAEDANMSHAARRLHISQPAVHAQIRRLSEELGVTLYRRAGRGLVLTEEGTEVAAFARDLAERTERLALRVRGRQGPERIVLASGAGALLYIVAEGLRAFTKRKTTRLEVIALDASAAFDAVRSGIAHVGIAAAEAAPEDLECHRITSVGQVVAMPRTHPLARQRSVSLEKLDGERMILPPAGRPHRKTLDAALQGRGVRVEVVATARGWELTVKLVELGFGVAIVNGCCTLPRAVVARPVPQLPAVTYLAFTRAGPSETAASLVRTLVQHGDGWRAL
jgi:DNA-binding transcriptional LysR family regulator